MSECWYDDCDEDEEDGDEDDDDDCTPGFEVIECREDGTVMQGFGCQSCDCATTHDLTADYDGRVTCEPGTNTWYYDEDLDGNVDDDGEFNECWYDDCSEDDDDDDGDDDGDDDDDDDECDIETSNDLNSSPSGTTNHGAGKGWCFSNLRNQIGCTASPADCWERCSDGYGDDLVAIDWWDDGSCGCQNDCECMHEVGGAPGYIFYTVTGDSAVAALPVECGPTPDSPYRHVCATPVNYQGDAEYKVTQTCDQAMAAFTSSGNTLAGKDFSSVFDCGGKNVEVVETVNAIAAKCCGASGTSTCVSAPFVTGVLTLSGITAEAAEASKGVLRFAIADVAGVERDAVTIIGVAPAPARRRLQTGVVVDYVIETADNAASILAALEAAAADPSLVDTAIAAVDTASVFAGATTESITTAVADSAPPTPAPVSQATPSDGGGNGGADAASAGLIGGTVAGVAVIAAIAVGAYVYMRRAKDSADSAPMAEVEVLGTITGAVESGALKDAAPDPSAPPLMPPPPPEPAQERPSMLSRLGSWRAPAAEAPTGRNFCSACGAPVQGPFCSACGARA